jgi:hypothetical protein
VRLRTPIAKRVGAGFKPAPHYKHAQHLHGIIILADKCERRSGIPEIVRGFKTFSARRVNEHSGKRGVLWQRGYCERIVRNEKPLDRIRAYIANNPAQWADDPDNITRVASAERGRV